MKFKPGFFLSSILMLFSRMFERGMGLVSTLILARLLVPEDFGLVAISMLFVFLIEVLGKSGINEYIIRKDEVSMDDLNSAWTLNFILKALFAFLGFLSSGFVASFFGDERLSAVICVMLITAPLYSLKNPQLIMYVRSQDYRYETVISVVKKISSVITVVSVAFIYQSYWAIVLSSIVAAVVGVISSYILIPFKPKLTLVNFSQQWGFAKWSFLKEIVIYLRNQIDSIFISKFYSVDVFGGYHVSKYLGTMPSSQLAEPILSPLLAEFSKVKNDNKLLLLKLRVSIFLTLSLLIPICIFGYYESHLIVELLLGSKWIGFSYVFSIMLLTCIAIEIQRISTYLLICINMVSRVFFINLFTLIALVFSYYYLVKLDLETFMLFKFFIDLFVACTMLLYAFYLLGAIRYFFTVVIITSFVILNCLVSIYLAGISANYFCFLTSTLFATVFLKGVFFTLFYLVIFLFYLLIYNFIFKLNKFRVHECSVVTDFLIRVSSSKQN